MFLKHLNGFSWFQWGEKEEVGSGAVGGDQKKKKKHLNDVCFMYLAF